MELAGGSENTSVLVSFGAKVDPLIAQGEIWRLLTPAFLHIGFLHLLINTISLLTLGSSAETLFGHVRFAAIYMVSAISGSVLSFLLSPAISAGASGAIFGLGGALAVYYYRRRNDGTVERNKLANILFTLGLNLVYGLFAPGIDFWGHVGGLLGGGLLAVPLLASTKAVPQPVWPNVETACGPSSAATSSEAEADDGRDGAAPFHGWGGSLAATARRSVHSPEFYQSIPRRPIGSALSYFLFLCLPAALVGAIPTVAAMVRISDAAPYIQEIFDAYPAELELRIRHGSLSSNVDEPFFVAQTRLLSQDGNTPRHLAVIDTSTPVSAEQFAAYDALIWVTRDRLLTRDPNSPRGFSATDLPEAGDFTIDRWLAGRTSTALQGWLPALGLGMAALALIFSYCSSAIRLIYMLPTALLVLGITRVAGTKLDYAGAYKTGVFGMTAALGVETVVSLTHGLTGFGGVPFMFTLVTLGVVWINVRRATASIRAHQSDQVGTATL
jgi:membrane associated rhomboid family serine protease